MEKRMRAIAEEAARPATAPVLRVDIMTAKRC